MFSTWLLVVSDRAIRQFPKNPSTHDIPGLVIHDRVLQSKWCLCVMQLNIPHPPHTLPPKTSREGTMPPTDPPHGNAHGRYTRFDHSFSSWKHNLYLTHNNHTISSNTIPRSFLPVCYKQRICICCLIFILKSLRAFFCCPVAENNGVAEGQLSIHCKCNIPCSYFYI